MRLPPSIELPDGKFRDYLLTVQESGDKLAFLALGGYYRENWPLLQAEVRSKAVASEATFHKSSYNGDYFEFDIELDGPSGKKLPVTTIWLQEEIGGVVRFITLFPRRRRK